MQKTTIVRDAELTARYPKGIPTAWRSPRRTGEPSPGRSLSPRPRAQPDVGRGGRGELPLVGGLHLPEARAEALQALVLRLETSVRES